MLHGQVSHFSIFTHKSGLLSQIITAKGSEKEIEAIRAKKNSSWQVKDVNPGVKYTFLM